MSINEINPEQLRMAYAEKKYNPQIRKSKFVIKLIYRDGKEELIPCDTHEQMNEQHREILSKLWNKY
ncbi:MAG: hypothetical protein A3H98_13515 [Bacteroidetes bacterium RIFCSPLOWO2_02_FULL_36_8]|nr:MAG: hypothetical protein A3H98_13515 [Bacteroidetes bacterium RIFCSPLOWO2_02_FULL_36_8]OFY71775.1 MAG: hypothetical protein A3G23_13735 [Bacteroidetes bacterium RIFCSPLOWO2_12_FULL_37_12]